MVKGLGLRVYRRGNLIQVNDIGFSVQGQSLILDFGVWSIGLGCRVVSAFLFNVEGTGLRVKG